MWQASRPAKGQKRNLECSVRDSSHALAVVAAALAVDDEIEVSLDVEEGLAFTWEAQSAQHGAHFIGKVLRNRGCEAGLDVAGAFHLRSTERRVGKEWIRKCYSRGGPSH